MSNVRLNQNVYVITFSNGEPYCLTKGKVYMKNNNSFILEDMLSEATIEEYKIPCDFDEEGLRWFRTLKEAREYIKSKGYILIKTYDDCWNVE